jgi:hypothetical protein
MLIRKLILGSVVAASLASFALPAAARTNVDLVVNLGAPPPAYYEPVPVARRGFAWVPGYWDWTGRRYHWVAGHWVRHRPGFAYVSPRYYDDGGRWYYQRGGWRDRDGDGIPNRWDRFPGNPYWR